MPKTSCNNPFDLASQVLKGNIRAASKLLTLAENRSPQALPHLKTLYPHTGKARLIGITGPAGTGKSTLVNQLISHYRKKRKKIGVLAIDPTSPISGGAILGDRIRLHAHFLDHNVFIRSLAAQGNLGGLSPALFDAVHILDAMGKDIIFIETIGVGQDEVRIANLAETVLLVLTPGMGDVVQTMKSGLLEIGDVVAVNKRDLFDGASLISELEEAKPGRPVLAVSAQDGSGINALVSKLESVPKTKQDLRAKKRGFIREELLWLLYEKLSPAGQEFPFSERRLTQLLQRKKNPYDTIAQWDKKPTQRH